MKKHFSFGIALATLALLVTACGGNTAKSSSAPLEKSSSSKSTEKSSSKGPVKSVSNLSISLGNENSKAYITVRGTQNNYTADDFVWAWGLREQNSSIFVDGKETPAASDYKAATFNSNNEFTVKYCLSDIENIKAGTLYRIYGGTPESYGDIPFESNMFGANDSRGKYYLRQDENNSLIFEFTQPITYSLASVVEVTQSELPDGVTVAGAYLKVGGVNSKGLTVETINGWNTNGKIAGDFQRVIVPDGGSAWQQHSHTDSERFWKIEGDNVFFYLYCGFIEMGEGWMVHFDVMSGNQTTGLQTSTKFSGETAYTVGDAVYKIYSDTSKSGEENYWGCLGVYRETVA